MLLMQTQRNTKDLKCIDVLRRGPIFCEVCQNFFIFGNTDLGIRRIVSPRQMSGREVAGDEEEAVASVFVVLYQNAFCRQLHQYLYFCTSKASKLST